MGHMHGTLLLTSHIVMHFFTGVGGLAMVAFGRVLLLYYTHEHTHTICPSDTKVGRK